MLAVVGAAGAYGMPEKLTTQALAASMARLNMKFARMEPAAPDTEHPVQDHVVQVADSATLKRGAWARANRIAKRTLDARVWLPEVNKATHYHAAYVRPN
jgi:hypothetical protein